MSESNIYDNLEEIQSNNDHLDSYYQYYGNILDLQFKNNNLKSPPYEMEEEEEQLPSSDNYEYIINPNDDNQNLVIEPSSPCQPLNIPLLDQLNTQSVEKAEKIEESARSEETTHTEETECKDIDVDENGDNSGNGDDERDNNREEDNSDFSDGSDDEDENKKIRFKSNRSNNKTRRDGDDRKIRGLLPFGKTQKCCKCNKIYDKNILFILSEDESTSIEGKPYICIWCSLRYHNHKMLRDWEVNPESPILCYRCNCRKSDCRFKKIRSSKKSYCSYCSLKKKRTYMLTSGKY